MGWPATSRNSPSSVRSGERHSSFPRPSSAARRSSWCWRAEARTARARGGPSRRCPSSRRSSASCWSSTRASPKIGSRARAPRTGFVMSHSARRSSGSTSPPAYSPYVSDPRPALLQREREIEGGPHREVVRSPWVVGVVVLVIYGAWLVAFFVLGHNALDFTFRSPGFLNQSHASSVIKPDPSVTSNAGAYDSQFFYYLALDPVNARYYMDANTYRYTRILYPMVARALGLGQPGLIPYTLILVNWLALAGGATALAAWLRRKRVSPWFALVYGL